MESFSSWFGILGTEVIWFDNGELFYNLFFVINTFIVDIKNWVKKCWKIKKIRHSVLH